MRHKFSIVSLVVALSMIACSLGPVSTPIAQPPTITSNTPIAQAPTIASNAPVQILSPSNGAALAAAPVQVQFVANAGPYIEIDLFVDGTAVANLSVPANQTRVTGSLQWTAPTAGAHTLRISALDMNKVETTAEVQIQIGTGNPPTNSPPTINPPINGTTSPPSSSSGMQVRFVNATEGGTVAATTDETGKPIVTLQLEVTGIAPIDITLTANGIIIPGEIRNSQLIVPFRGELRWSPLNGGGTYTLVANAVSPDKEAASATVHVTVSGVPVFTATPPPLTAQAARAKFAELYQHLFGINVPSPTIHRFESATLPYRSRWISAVYTNGQFHYIDLFDDGHTERSGGPYTDPAHPSRGGGYTYCRPAGTYKILVVFVDYGTFSVNRTEVLAEVAPMAAWLNSMYDRYATSQGFASSPLHITADGAYMTVPSTPRVLTTALISAGTGVDPAPYDFIIQIDLDAHNTIGQSEWKGILEAGGGIALQGCGPNSFGAANIWSVVSNAAEVRGVLVMDFNHEFSHLFGMMDSWPFTSGTLYDGTALDDWIPYDMFGWSDADGDGVPEILDTTPYGSSGPRP
jgi:hypothetical protein